MFSSILNGRSRKGMSTATQACSRRYAGKIQLLDSAFGGALTAHFQILIQRRYIPRSKEPGTRHVSGFSISIGMGAIFARDGEGKCTTLLTKTTQT